MDELLDANRANWDERTALHLEAYPVRAFLAGQTTLHQIELLEVGDVTDRALLHLQCHFGLDTLSWARRGACVTGIDFAGTAISAARALAREVGVDARFIESDMYGLSDDLSGTIRHREQSIRSGGSKSGDWRSPCWYMSKETWGSLAKRRRSHGRMPFDEYDATMYPGVLRGPHDR
jgi:hypothetical protein